MDRLLELVSSGLDEGFLVGALRDALTRHLELMLDTERANTNRQRSRDGMAALADDPAGLQRYRERLAKEDPSYAAKSETNLQLVCAGWVTSLSPSRSTRKPKLGTCAIGGPPRPWNCSLMTSSRLGLCGTQFAEPANRDRGHGLFSLALPTPWQLDPSQCAATGRRAVTCLRSSSSSCRWTRPRVAAK